MAQVLVEAKREDCSDRPARLNCRRKSALRFVPGYRRVGCCQPGGAVPGPARTVHPRSPQIVRGTSDRTPAHIFMSVLPCSGSACRPAAQACRREAHRRLSPGSRSTRLPTRDSAGACPAVGSPTRDSGSATALPDCRSTRVRRQTATPGRPGRKDCARAEPRSRAQSQVVCGMPEQLSYTETQSHSQRQAMHAGELESAAQTLTQLPMAQATWSATQPVHSSVISPCTWS
jgi:hypothetical protein